jgi:UDP-2,3-diacylglucosamine pyrophosphatase LpxH
MAEAYCLISDLHIGGDGALDICEFESELIELLQDLEREPVQTELIIAGDAFGLWEVTEAEGVDKLRTIMDQHQRLFDQLRQTGQRVPVTLIPGNHDHELACDPGFAVLLAECNIHLESREHITRPIGDRKIWIEHGHQRDGFNRIAEFGNAHATPLGFFITQAVVGNAGKYAAFGQQEWLKDLESVQPNEDIPYWLFSNYFYREMSPVLRYVLLPFLLLFGVSSVVLGGFVLERLGVLPTKIFVGILYQNLGLFGNLFGMICAVNAMIILLLLLASIPLGVIRRDIARTLRRYGLRSTDTLIPEKREVYRAAAQGVFDQDEQTAVFVFGHTHDAFVERIGDRVWLNTGTWLKRLKRVKGRCHLPDVYYPSFELSCVRIAVQGRDIVISYEGRGKDVDPQLTLTQRLAIVGKSRTDDVDVPHRTVVKGLSANERSDNACTQAS